MQTLLIVNFPALPAAQLPLPPTEKTGLGLSQRKNLAMGSLLFGTVKVLQSFQRCLFDFF
jgi:hypothetical protein